MSHIPKVGEAITVADFDKIVEAVEKRRHKHPNESIAVSMGVVLFNIGDIFAKGAKIKLGWVEAK